MHCSGCPWFFPSERNLNRHLALYVIAAHILVITAFASNLNDLYEKQRRFNTTMERLRQEAATTPVTLQ